MCPRLLLSAHSAGDKLKSENSYSVSAIAEMKRFAEQ